MAAKNNHQDKQLGLRVFSKVGKVSVKYRWLILVIWIIGTFLVVKQLPSLNSVTQSNNSNFLPASSQSTKAIKLVSSLGQSNTTQPVPVVLETSSGTILSQANQQAIDHLEQLLAGSADVKKVQTAGTSGDGQAQELVVEALPQGGSGPGPFVATLRATIKQANLPSNLSAHLAGDLATAVDSSSGSGTTNNQLQLVSIIFIVVLLLLIFRAPLAPLITLIPAVIVVTASGPLIAEAAKHGLKVSVLAQLLLTVLVLGAGSDYGLFLIFRVREELRGGLAKNEAIIKAMSRVGESITFSAATVIAALLSLLFASFQIYSNLGVPLAIGIGLMLLAGLTLTPALLAIFGRAVFWPMIKVSSQPKYGIWGRICAKVVAKPVLVLIIGLIFFGSLALAIPGYKAGGFAGNTAAPKGSDSAEGNLGLAKHFPASSANPTEPIFVFTQSVWSSPQVLLTIQTDLARQSVFKSVSGPLSPNGYVLSPAQLRSLYLTYGPPSKLSASSLQSVTSLDQLKVLSEYRLLSNYISPDGKTVIYATSLTAGNPGGTAAMNAVPAIRSAVNKVAQQVGATNNGVAGEAPALYDINTISSSDLIRVVPIAILVIGVLLAILLRSLVAPLYLVASVGLSYLAALGLAVLVFIDIGKGSGLVFILPFLMFLFLLALGEDYNILVMTRIREESHDLPLREAVPKALNTTGTTVTSAGLVLAGTFTVFAIVGGSGAGGSEVSDIGFGLAAGIIMDTFLVRTLLVPSTVVLLGKLNWWPSKHGSWVAKD